MHSVVKDGDCGISCVTLGSLSSLSFSLLVCKMKLLILDLQGCGKGKVRHIRESALKAMKHSMKAREG